MKEERLIIIEKKQGKITSIEVKNPNETDRELFYIPENKNQVKWFPQDNEEARDILRKLDINMKNWQ